MNSRIQVSHAGGATTPKDKQRAERETKSNNRYRWIGEKPRWQAVRILARSRLLVLSSISEGGANVVSEALACGIPVLSTRISGSIGLLGKDYPGYFPVGDTQALANLLHRAETDSDFYSHLTSEISALSRIVRPNAEKSALHKLVRELI